MYKLVLKGRKGQFDAKGTYDEDKQEFIVKKGSRVSQIVSSYEKFKGAVSVNKMRETNTKDYIVTKDTKFKSPSTAANFVTGSSTNGMVAWKDENGKSLKQLKG